MDSYALLECGREPANGRFSSLVRHTCPPESFSLTKIDLDIRDVAALGGYGAWSAQRDAEKIVEPRRDEPLLDSLEEILDRWIQGHSRASGISLEATQALGQEAEKLLGVLVEDSSVDISAAVALKLRHIVDYLEQLNAFWAATHTALVDSSGSDDAWRVPHRPSREVAREIVAGMEESAYRKPGWWLGALAADSLILPIVGPILRRSSAGWLITHLQDRRQHRLLMKRLADYSDLVSLHVAKNQLLVIAAMLTEFLAAQRLGAQATLYARGISDGQSAVLLGPRTARPWYTRPFRRRWELSLTALAAPATV